MNRQELHEKISSHLKTAQLKIGTEPRTTYVDKNEVLNLIANLDEAEPKAKTENYYQVVFSFSHRLPLTFVFGASNERQAISLALKEFNRNSLLNLEVIENIYVSRER